jgi:hypothetical protein
MRQLLKTLLPARIRFFLRLENYKDLLLFSGFCCKRFLAILSSLPGTLALHQSIPTVQLGGSAEKDPVGRQLTELFTSYKVNFNQGRHCLYISDKGDMQKIVPGLTERYPCRIGLKIVKSREISRDGTPYYTSRKIAPATNVISMLAVGTVLEKVVISNILSTFGCAPRVYDVIRLTSADVCYYALVVEHIDGDNITGEVGRLFIDKLEDILRKQHIEIVAVKRNKDFKAPAFNQNIIDSTRGCKYIDIQNFAIFSQREHCFRGFVEKLAQSHILADVEISERNNLSIFAKRKLNRKICEFSLLWCHYLAGSGISLENTTLFDAGLPLGVYTMSALAHDARWSYVYDDKNEVISRERFLYRNGFSRFCSFSSSSENQFQKKISVDLFCFSYQSEAHLLTSLLGVVDTKYLLVDFPVAEDEDQNEKGIELVEGNTGFARVTGSTTIFSDTMFTLFMKRELTL